MSRSSRSRWFYQTGSEPTDFEILDALSDGRRNNAANLAYLLEKDRSYLNTRLPVLADFGLIERVSPAPNSGLYVITDRGQAALSCREQYGDPDIDFETLLEETTAE